MLKVPARRWLFGLIWDSNIVKTCPNLALNFSNLLFAGVGKKVVHPVPSRRCTLFGLIRGRILNVSFVNGRMKRFRIWVRNPHGLLVDPK